MRLMAPVRGVTLAPPAADVLNPWRMVTNLWRHRQAIRHMVRRDLSQRYRGSFLGVLWSFIVPLMMLSVYTFVFSVVLKARWRSAPDTMPMEEFSLTLFAGLTPFNVFAEVISRSPTLVLAVPNYVKKVVFPLEILPVVAVGAALVNSLIYVGILLLGSLLLLNRISPTVLFLPLAYLPLVFLVLGLSWLLASLGVYIRDIGQGIAVVVQILFFLSPVFYPPSAVPEPFRVLMMANPMTTILIAFRQTLLWGEAISWVPWAVWTLLTGVLMVMGYAWFMKTKRGFADVL